MESKLDQENVQPPGRSIPELMKVKRKTTEMSGPAGKRRKVDNKDAAIDIKLVIEVTEGMCMMAEKLKIMLEKDKKRMDDGGHGPVSSSPGEE